MENLAAKRELFGSLDKIVKKSAILGNISIFLSLVALVYS